VRLKPLIHLSRRGRILAEGFWINKLWPRIADSIQLHTRPLDLHAINRT
jgi:hypothetical protein